MKYPPTTLTVVIAAILLMACSCSTSSDQPDQQEPEPDEVAEAEEVAQASDEATNDGDDEQARVDEEVEERPTVDMWSEEGLETQDRMEELRALRPEMEPGTTPWRASRHQIPDELARGDRAEGPATPGAALTQLAAELNLADGIGVEAWEQTFRVLQDDGEAAVGVILLWGFKDDSLAGSDLRVHLERGDQAWYVEELEERAHCRRGVTDDGLCL